MPQPLSYHHQVSEHFRKQRKTWDFFAAAKTREDQLLKYKTELLKNTYKFNSTSDPLIYQKVETAKEKLGLQGLDISVYQAQFSEEINASIVFLHGEAHIVFNGRITQLLNDEELLAVIAHELTHIKLFTVENGEFEIANRIITAIANNYNSEPSYYETARLFRLYTEIYCDRGAYLVTGNIEPVITSLVKVATGLEKVSSESYLKQAEEIFSMDKEASAATISHPENFIRARAIDLWHKSGEESEKEIIRMIEGRTTIDNLDIFKQKKLSDLTRTFLQLYLKPKWFQSTMILSQAKEFFPDFSLSQNVTLSDELKDLIAAADDSVKNYLCYLLLDFAVADKALEEIPLGLAFQLAEDTGLKNQFDSIIKKEFRLSEKKLQQQKNSALASYHQVKETAAENIYES